MKADTEKLKRAIRHGVYLLGNSIPWANPLALLGALAELESNFGLNATPKYEKAYAFGERYYSVEQIVRFREWGAWACCSYGSFQIMYPTACELGFDLAPWSRSPSDLNDDEIGVIFVVEYIKRRIVRKGASNIAQFADAYNSGTYLDASIPHEYVNKFAMSYHDVVERRLL